MLQQYLPFTVLKLQTLLSMPHQREHVATVLTVYGIETIINEGKEAWKEAVATVLTVYGIETVIFLLRRSGAI